MLLSPNYFKIKFGALQIILSLVLWFAVYNSGIDSSKTGILVAFATPTKFLPGIEKAIHGYLNFLILPLFAMANTAIFLPSDIGAALKTNVGLGIIFGLVVGKPLGIFIFSRVLVALNLASLPRGVQWKQILGMVRLHNVYFYDCVSV